METITCDAKKKVHTLGVESTHKVFKNLFSVMQNAVHMWMKGPTHRRSCVLKNTRVRVDVALIRVKHIQMEPTVPRTPISPERRAHLLVIQSCLHRRPVLHLLGQPTIAGASQMLLLHGGSNAYRSGLLVLQHVSEALEVGGKKKEEVKEGDRGYTEEEEAGFHIMSFLIWTIVAAL